MDTGKKDYRGKKDNNGAVRMGDAIGTTDAIAQLNALADASAPADEPRYDLEKVTRSMARRAAGDCGPYHGVGGVACEASGEALA